MNEFVKNPGGIPQKWMDVQRIPIGRVSPADRESLLEYVETPLKQAVVVLYDKNILTIGSSCNATDFVRGSAWITLDGASLSQANQAIVDNYPLSERTVVGEKGVGLPIIGLHFPISESDDPFDVGMRALELASKFEKQEFTWVNRWTIDEVRANFVHTSIDLSTCALQILIEQLTEAGYYFDSDSGYVYKSVEQFKKVQDASPDTNS